TEGQVRGSANGQLPAGFLPITATGATAKLYESAQTVAAAFLRQDGTVVKAQPTPGPTTPPPSSPPVPPRPVAPSAAAPVVPELEPTTVEGLPAEDGETVAAVKSSGLTPSLRSGAANNALPVALSVGLAGAFASPLLRLWATRRRPL
ncbi:MAG TPA: hypothetical protein PKB06_06410, partial [Actinotalea sp.]|nr:hypothetical protein [Actinotalea sp.]